MSTTSLAGQGTETRANGCSVHKKGENHLQNTTSDVMQRDGEYQETFLCGSISAEEKVLLQRLAAYLATVDCVPPFLSERTLILPDPGRSLTLQSSSKLCLPSCEKSV
jgi:hypothetical protein